MVEDKRSEDPALAGFYEAMEWTNVEKITDEILASLSSDLSFSEDFYTEKTMMPKIVHGGQVMLCSENPLLRKDRLRQ
jgi:hypothetical protein